MREDLETDRLRLREWSPEDAPAAFALYGDPDVVRFLGREPAPDLETERGLFLERLGRNAQLAPRGLGSWALVERDSGEVVGNMLLKPLPPTTDEIEVGWHLLPRVWGRGYASEAAVEVLRYGFETLGLEQIVAVVEPSNSRSSAVARRIGMQWLERTTRYYDGLSLEFFGMTRSAWRERGALTS